MKSSGNIFRSLLSFLLLVFIGYLTLFVNDDYIKEEEKLIQVYGNNLLAENDYLVFTKLENTMDNKKVGAAFIKDRFEKHPYVAQANVELNGRKEIKITTIEKTIKAIIIVNSEPFLISEDYQVLPLFPNINSVDVPVISNIRTGDKIKTLSYLKNSDMINAFRIIDAAAALNNTSIFRNLAEINLRPGITPAYEKDIVLNFNELNPAVVFGRGDEAKKMLCLETIWNNLSSGNLRLDKSDYIDLRYTTDVYFGSKSVTGRIQ